MTAKSVTIVVTYSDEYDSEHQIDRLTEQLDPLLRDGTINTVMIEQPEEETP